MGKLIKYIVGVLALGIETMVLFSSCDRQDEPYLIGKHRLSETEENNGPGISFNMDSDSLEEEPEEIHFNAEKWGEEGKVVDL